MRQETPEEARSLNAKGNTGKIVVGSIIAIIIILLVILFVPRPNIYGAAQTINGNVISEDAVTERINQTREYYDLEDDEDWKNYLEENNQTPATIRFATIQQLETYFIYDIVADELGVSVSDEEVQSELQNQIQTNYNGDESEWKNYLTENNISENEFTKNIYYTLLQQQISETFRDEANAKYDDQAILDTINATYGGDALLYHCYLINWDSSNEEYQKMAENVVNGSMSYEDFAIELYGSLDNVDQGYKTTSDLDGGLFGLLQSAGGEGKPSEIGEGIIADGVNSLFMWDTQFVIDGELTDKQQVPEDFFQLILDSATETTIKNMAQKYIENWYDSASIVLYPMPSGLPYDVK